MTKELFVLSDRVIGRVVQGDRARMAFTPDEAWRKIRGAYPLSLSRQLAALQRQHDVVSTQVGAFYRTTKSCSIAGRGNSRTGGTEMAKREIDLDRQRRPWPEWSEFVDLPGVVAVCARRSLPLVKQGFGAATSGRALGHQGSDVLNRSR